MRKFTESRRNPELNTINRRKNGLDVVRSFLGREDAFLSMSHMNKVGVKPIFEHQTPMGVYAYPLAAEDVRDYLRTGTDDLPYRGTARFAHIIIADIPDSRMLSVYTNAARLEESLHQTALQEELGFLWPTILRQADRKLKKSQSQERIIRAYAASRSLAYYIKVKRTKGLAEMADCLDEEFIPDSQIEEFQAMGMWNALLRKAGFDAMTDEGIGYIHQHEQTQTCFFTTQPFRNLITVELHSGEYSANAKEIGSVKHLERLIRDGLDPVEAMEIMRAMVQQRGTPTSRTEWSYRAGVRPTKGEVDRLMNMLKGMHPESGARFWGTTSTRNDAVNDLADYVRF